MNSLGESLLAEARAAGFLAAVIDIAPVIDGGQGRCVAAGLKKYRAAKEGGVLSVFPFLVRNESRLLDPRRVFPEAKSMLIVAMPYPNYSPPGDGPRHAAYLGIPDYHELIESRLQAVLESVNGSLRWKICVDASAILEKAWAAEAGLGWIGKNGLLITPEHGSMVLLGEALIDAETCAPPSQTESRCGECINCLEACPTHALSESIGLEPGKCISFATLEDKTGMKATSVPSDRKTWVAGCDECQNLCPYNGSVNGSHPLNRNWNELLAETDAEYADRVKGTAIARIPYARYRRALEIAHQNSAGGAVRC